MAGNGRASLNARLDKLRDADLHEELTVQIVGNLSSQLQHAAENMHPNVPRQNQKTMQKMAENLQVAHQASEKTSGQWRRAAQLDFAVHQSVRAAPTASRTPQSVADTLQQFVAGESCRAARLTLQEPIISDATSSLCGVGEVRLSTFVLDGHVSPEPANGSWYQTSGAVKLLYELKESQARMMTKLIERWNAHTPPQVAIHKGVLLKKVQLVQTAVRGGKMSVDGAVQHQHDQACSMAKAGAVEGGLLPSTAGAVYLALALALALSLSLSLAHALSLALAHVQDC